MDLSKIKKDLFSVKKQTEKGIEPKIEIPNLTSREIVNYEEYGFNQAGRLGGSVAGLRVNLQKIYYDFRQKVKKDIEKQNELRRPFIVKIEEYKGDIERLSNKIEKTTTESIPKTKNLLERLKEELSYIKKNPQEITGDDTGKVAFIIGGIILIFLTVYLFIFYSSASYSTFFKDFKLNEIGVANSIFDPKALTIAFQNGITELILIVTIPFVFLG
ncbi:MAG TPA: hypothetical protein VMW01_00255 [Williamwhitmania sp.]|nr:hypothetical protein [Williamwhitmania sp.]